MTKTYVRKTMMGKVFAITAVLLMLLVSIVPITESTSAITDSQYGLYGMGRNNNYQQGDTTNINVTSPKQIGSGLGTITKITCSDSNTFFIVNGVGESKTFDLSGCQLVYSSTNKDKVLSAETALDNFETLVVRKAINA